MQPWAIRVFAPWLPILTEHLRSLALTQWARPSQPLEHQTLTSPFSLKGLGSIREGTTTLNRIPAPLKEPALATHRYNIEILQSKIMSSSLDFCTCTCAIQIFSLEPKHSPYNWLSHKGDPASMVIGGSNLDTDVWKLHGKSTFQIWPS